MKTRKICKADLARFSGAQGDITRAMKRQLRAPLLTAFDKWEKAVVRGREEDDPTVMEWYKRLLDLDDAAFDSVPARVAYYI